MVSVICEKIYVFTYQNLKKYFTATLEQNSEIFRYLASVVGTRYTDLLSSCLTRFFAPLYMCSNKVIKAYKVITSNEWSHKISFITR